jgi:hypothetical protein
MSVTDCFIVCYSIDDTYRYKDFGIVGIYKNNISVETFRDIMFAFQKKIISRDSPFHKFSDPDEYRRYEYSDVIVKYKFIDTYEYFMLQYNKNFEKDYYCFEGLIECVNKHLYFVEIIKIIQMLPLNDDIIKIIENFYVDFCAEDFYIDDGFCSLSYQYF